MHANMHLQVEIRLAVAPAAKHAQGGSLSRHSAASDARNEMDHGLEQQGMQGSLMDQQRMDAGQADAFSCMELDVHQD